MPGALSKVERGRLDAAEARLAEAMAGHDSAAQRWVDLKAARWQGQHETTLVGGIKQRVMRSVPSEADVSTAERAKEATDATRRLPVTVPAIPPCRRSGARASRSTIRS